MAYNTKPIVTDKNGNPISQYYNPSTDQYESVEGTGGGNKVVLYNTDGTENNSLSLVPILDKLSQLTGTVIDEETRKSNETIRQDNEIVRIALYDALLVELSRIEQITEQVPEEVVNSINGLRNLLGDLQNLDTIEKDNLVLALNEIYQDLVAHKEESIHQGKSPTLEATSTSDATSAINAPLKSAGGLGVAKTAYINEGLNIANGNYKVVSFMTSLSSDEHIEIEFRRETHGIHALTTFSMSEQNTSNGDFLHYLFALYAGAVTIINDEMVLLSKGWTKEVISWEHMSSGVTKMIIGNDKTRYGVSIVLEMRSSVGYNVEFFVRPN